MSPSSGVLRLGTRGSALAMWQAGWTKNALERRWPGISVELIPIKTTGDKVLDTPLATIGGKGLFTKELDDALLENRIDAAVHSLKDVPFRLPDGIELAAIPEREDPRDAFLSNGPRLQQMPAGSQIGTSSLRRQAQLLHRFPGLQVAMLRGNVDTRIRKLESGAFDGIILAVAGLKRLGHENRITQTLDDDVMLSAAGQGALGMVCRTSDEFAASLLAALNHPPTRTAVTAERALLRALGGSCQIPIASRARLEGSRLTIQGLVASADGRRLVRLDLEGDSAQADALGFELGQQLLAQGAREILDAIGGHVA